jgi:peroxiredoxin
MGRLVKLRRFICLAAAALAASASCGPLPAGQGDPQPRQARDFEFQDINPRSPTHGKKLALRDLYAERGLVLQFTASWCEYCRVDLPALQDLFVKERIPLVLVAADENGFPESMGIVAERAALSAPILYVPPRRVARMARAYTHEILPATYLIDRSGRIVREFVGAKPVAELAQAIRVELTLGP